MNVSCRLAIPIALSLGGCQSLFGIDKDPGSLPDATVGADGDPDRECWGTDIDVCVRPPASAPLALAGTFDTGAMCTVVDDDLCVVAGTDVTIGDLRVFGPRPLVVIARGTLAVTGTLDAASHRAGANPVGPGVGATAATCAAFPGAPGFAQNGGGSGGGAAGGAGGTFADAGGNGGKSVSTAAGAVAGITAHAFRAGCSGQNGGTRGGGVTAVGGKGGGAVYLISAATIEVTGAINASGASGDAGTCASCAGSNPTTQQLLDADAYGGGGGGSGGTIILEAPTVDIAASAKVFADGGGGGQGASRSATGAVGAEPTGLTPAPGGLGANDGGTGPNNGGNGGPGAHAATKTGTIGADGESSYPGGGGGGGGGAGYVKTIGTLTNAGTISPTP